jgi:ABC-2 type transport system ATP-binding protein
MSSQTPAIETTRLSKTYGGEVRALVDVDLRVEQGEVFGFLGPNGAGKSTLIRILLDLIRPTAGTASLLGQDSRAAGGTARREVGYLPGDLRLWPRDTGRAQLASLSAMRGGGHEAEIATLAERLGAQLDRPVRDLSKGNRQKIGLIQAFMHRPRLAVLDEPTSGVDPLVQETFRALVRESAAAGRTVFLSSHSLDEVQHVAGRVGIIRGGRLVAVESVETLLARSVRHMRLTFAAAVDAAEFAGLPGVQSAESEGATLRLSVRGSADAVVKHAARHEVLDVVSEPADLEEIFLSYYTESGHA